MDGHSTIAGVVQVQPPPPSPTAQRKMSRKLHNQTDSLELIPNYRVPCLNVPLLNDFGQGHRIHYIANLMDMNVGVCVYRFLT